MPKTNLWLISDLRDARAKVRPPKAGWLSLATNTLPAVGAGVLAIIDPASSLLGHLPAYARVVRILVPVLLAIVACVAISHRRLQRRAAAGFGGETPEAWCYRYNRDLRRVAKLSLVPLLAWAAFEVHDNAPNVFWGRNSLAGYVCRADGRPFGPHAAVSLRDDFNAQSSVGTTETDDHGYFVLRLDPWAKKPHFVRVQADGCGDRQQPIRNGTRGQSACPRDELGLPQTRERVKWVVYCN